MSPKPAISQLWHSSLSRPSTRTRAHPSCLRDQGLLWNLALLGRLSSVAALGSSLSHPCPCLAIDAILWASLSESLLSSHSQPKGRGNKSVVRRQPGALGCRAKLQDSHMGLAEPGTGLGLPASHLNLQGAAGEKVLSPLSPPSPPVPINRNLFMFWVQFKKPGGIQSLARVIKTQNTLQAKCGHQPAQGSSSSQRSWGFLLLFWKVERVLY